MNTQSRLLDIDYLKIRLLELKEIKRNEIKVEFHHSNRPNSMSLYLEFWTRGTEKDFWVKNHTLRISDHTSNSPHTQFIISPNDDLTKKKKEQFMKCLQLCVKKTHYKEFVGKLSSNSRRFEESEF